MIDNNGGGMPGISVGNNSNAGYNMQQNNQYRGQAQQETTNGGQQTHH